MTISQYPEHEKMMAVEEKIKTCTAFLEFLSEKFVLAEHSHFEDCPVWDTVDEDDCDCDPRKPLFPASVHVKDLLAEFFGIDSKKLLAEKMLMLEEQKAISANTDVVKP